MRYLQFPDNYRRFTKPANILKSSLVILAGLFLFAPSVIVAVSIVINAEQGTLTGQANVFSDLSAANGQAVNFGPSTPGVVLPNPGTWTNVTGNMSGMASECGNLTILSPVPGQDKLIAGVASRGLMATTNGGASWTALGTGTGSTAITNRPNQIVYDPLNANSFWLAGIYGNGIYHTSDGGNTFQRLGNTTHNDGISVDFSDPARQTLLAGGHEQSRTVYKSTNGGVSWTNIGANLPAGTGFSSFPLIINSQTYLINSDPSWGGGTPGVFRTTDGGTSWQKVSDQAPTKAPLITADGAYYWSSGDGLIKSTNQGQSWAKVGNGLNGEFRPEELPDGRLVSAGGGRLRVSSDGGVSWTSFGANLPFSFAAGVVYLSSRNQFYSWTWDCGNSVPTNAVQRLQ